MRKLRGFFVKNRVMTVFRCMLRRHRSSATYYQRLNPPLRYHADKHIVPSFLMSWTHNLRTKVKAICSGSGRGYLKDPVGERSSAAVPRGHLAVYVGKNGEGFERVLVPVIYFNHPLFGELLREAEEEFGYNHPGGITIPCRISEFERVQTRIKEYCCGSRRINARH